MFNGGGGNRRIRPLLGPDSDESDPPELETEGEGLALGKADGEGTRRGNNIGLGDGVVRGNKDGGFGPKGPGEGGTGEEGGGDRGGGTGEREIRGTGLCELYILDVGRGCRVAGVTLRGRTGGGAIALSLD